jgi:hypothetical protein
MNKWNLTEPEYIEIIQKKDLDIQKLKDTLSTNYSSDIISSININTSDNLKNNNCDH